MRGRLNAWPSRNTPPRRIARPCVADWRGGARLAWTFPRLPGLDPPRGRLGINAVPEGRHNLRNALAAAAVCAALGMNAAAVARAMAGFRGVKRRMEVFLESRGITFVDDFAHHPTAIRETIAAARQRWPQRTLHVLFEPRSNTVVTNRFQAEMNAAFARPTRSSWAHSPPPIPESERLDRTAIVRA